MNSTSWLNSRPYVHSLRAISLTREKTRASRVIFSAALRHGVNWRLCCLLLTSCREIRVQYRVRQSNTVRCTLAHHQRLLIDYSSECRHTPGRLSPLTDWLTDTRLEAVDCVLGGRTYGRQRGRRLRFNIYSLNCTGNIRRPTGRVDPPTTDTRRKLHWFDLLSICCRRITDRH